MKRLKTIIILLVLLISISSFATTQYYRIYLKNKNIYYGELLELIPNKSVKIKTLNKNILYFKWDEIEKIEKEKSIKVSNNETEEDNNKIFMKFKKLHILIGVGTFESDYLNGYHIFMELPIKKNKFGYFFTGFGFLKDADYFSMINILFGYKVFDASKAFTPILSGGFGYCLLRGDSGYNNSGPLIDLKTGINILNAKYGDIQFLIGLKMYTYQYRYWYCDPYYDACATDWISGNKTDQLVTYGISFGF